MSETPVVQASGKMRQRLLRWCSRMVSEGDGSPSSRRVLFFISVLVCLGLAIADFMLRGLAGAAMDLAKFTLGVTAAAFGVTRFAESNEKP